MKILIISPSYWPAFKFGGPIKSAHLLNKGLVLAGVDVTVYTTDAGLTPGEREDEIDGVKVHYFRSYGPDNFSFSPGMTLAMHRTLKGFDLVHIVGVWNYQTVSTAFLCRRYNVPYVVSPHGTLNQVVFDKRTYKKKMLYYGLFAERDLAEASGVHFTAK